jgi:formylglycine-generating enzyme required for sulfatase activity
MMYCDRCNIDFAEGLRYCKWCGQTLIERRRDTSELQTCPACSAAIQPAWAFCKSCGEPLDGSTREAPGGACPRCSAPTDVGAVNCSRCGLDLTSERDSGRITNSDATHTSALANCPSCSEALEAGSIYCKSCGSALYPESSPFGSSALLCSVCHSYSPLGSTTCRVCGALLIETEIDLSKRAGETISINQKKSSTLPDLADHLPVTEIVRIPEVSEDQPSQPDSGEVESGAHTVVFGESDPARLGKLIEEPPAAFDSEPSTSQGKATNLLPGVSGAQFEQQTPTALFNKTRTTAPVESDSPEEAQSSDSSGELGRADSGMVTLDAFKIVRPNNDEEADLPQGTSVLGSEAELRDTGSELSAHRTVIFGSGSTEAEDEIAATQWNEERPVVREEIMTAPFGLPPPPVERQEAGGTRVIHQEAQGLNGATAQETTLPDRSVEPSYRTNKEVEVAKIDNQAARVEPAPEKKKSSALIISIAAIILLAVAVSAIWYFMSGNQSPAQQTQAPPVADSPPVTPPATVPVAPQPPAPPPTPAVPEGMALVAGGAYIVGRDDADPVEKPQRTVNLPAFFIDRNEVTNADYKRFTDATGHTPPPNWKDGSYPAGKDNYPVTSVTWQDASDYATWAGKRLPTEVEWEAAARGTDGRIYPWGNKWERAFSNIGREVKTLKASEYANDIKQVGQFLEGASPAGALDMIGNVWEWTADEFALYPNGITEIPEDIKSVIKPGKTYRVIRGGAFDGSKIHDGSYRGLLDASLPYPKVGFRCVKDSRP